MDDRDFFDTLYQGWAKTTGAEDKFWMPEEDGRRHVDGDPRIWNVYAVDEKQQKWPVAEGLREEDAAFITAVHGCFADLVRRLHMAIDEADRLDYAADEREEQILELCLAEADLKDKVAEANAYADSMVGQIQELERQIAEKDANLDEIIHLAKVWGAPL